MDQLQSSKESPVAIESQINMCLQQYYEVTVRINELLNRDDDEIAAHISEYLHTRDTLINQYNDLNQRFSLIDNNYGGKQNSNNLADLLKKISAVEQENVSKFNHIYKINRNKIKQINNGRKMHDAYQGIHPIADGVFIDKRK